MIYFLSAYLAAGILLSLVFFGVWVNKSINASGLTLILLGWLPMINFLVLWLILKVELEARLASYKRRKT